MMLTNENLQEAARPGAMRTAAVALGLFLVAASQQAAAFFLFDPVITGADMAGMQVSAFFDDGTGVEDPSPSNAVWAAEDTITTDPTGEGFSGAARGSGWSLSQRGFTLGNVVCSSDFTIKDTNDCPAEDTIVVLGAWTATNMRDQPLLRLNVNASVAGIAFDIDLDNENTPGSNIGRPFEPDESTPTTFAYTDPLPGTTDLFGRLDISFTEGLGKGESLSYQADTDAFTVPTPGTLALLSAGGFLCLLRRRRRTQRG